MKSNGSSYKNSFGRKILPAFKVFGKSRSYKNDFKLYYGSPNFSTLVEAVPMMLGLFGPSIALLMRTYCPPIFNIGKGCSYFCLTAAIVYTPHHHAKGSSDGRAAVFITLRVTADSVPIKPELQVGGSIPLPSPQ